ncbi:MAG: trypsin-like peptidase domain-containing protein [Rhodopirellula sp.]|nr:trypsin-like peptidase domain-containing protein [Rhodopirellula sp.]
MMESRESVERRIVEVLLRHSSDAKKNRLLTGCVIAPGRILTAGHAFDGWEGTIELRWPCAEKESNPLPDDVREVLPKTASVKWRGEEKLDATVLECTIPDLLSDWISMASEVPPTHTVWRSMGFPKIGERDQTCRAIGFAGQTVSEAGAEDKIQLHSPEALEKAEELQGISGAPVFVGDRLVGIVQSYMEGFQTTRLDAVPAAQLLDDAGFITSIGMDPIYRDRAESRRSAVLNRLIVTLTEERLDAVRQTLAEMLELSVSDHGARESVSREVGEALLRDICRTCAALAEAHRRSCDEGQSGAFAAQQCDEMFRDIIPLAYPVGTVLTAQSQMGPSKRQLICTEISHALGFGVAIAAANLHPLDVEVVYDKKLEGHVARPRHHLVNSNTAPEGGREAVTAEVEAIVAELAASPRIPPLTGMAKAEAKKREESAANATDALVNRLNCHLAFHFQMRKRRFFFEYQQRQNGPDATQVTQKLAALFPQLEVIQLGQNEEMLYIDHFIEMSLVEMYENAKKLRSTTGYAESSLDDALGNVSAPSLKASDVQQLDRSSN